MRELILRELVRNNDAFTSGEQISKACGISRAGVWKYIELLKKEGYDIESVTKKGYKLLNKSIKMETAFHELKEPRVIGSDYVYFDEIGSTNDYARKIAREKGDGAVVICDKQLKGKGRMGRTWEAPSGKGIWMSVILKPKMVTADAVMVTQMAGVAVAKTLKDVGCKAEIKWPNDIVLDGKKVCGILTELDGELDKLNFILPGIGINVNHDLNDFSEDIKDKATSVKLHLGREVDRNDLLIKVLDNLDYYYDLFKKDFSLKKIIDECRKYSATLGKKIKVIYNNSTIEGKAIDLTDKGGLLVEHDGNVIEIISGEVSVRGLYGYV